MSFLFNCWQQNRRRRGCNHFNHQSQPILWCGPAKKQWPCRTPVPLKSRKHQYIQYNTRTADLDIHTFWSPGINARTPISLQKPAPGTLLLPIDVFNVLLSLSFTVSVPSPSLLVAISLSCCSSNGSLMGATVHARLFPYLYGDFFLLSKS